MVSFADLDVVGVAFYPRRRVVLDGQSDRHPPPLSGGLVEASKNVMIRRHKITEVRLGVCSLTYRTRRTLRKVRQIVARRDVHFVRRGRRFVVTSSSRRGSPPARRRGSPPPPPPRPLKVDQGPSSQCPPRTNAHRVPLALASFRTSTHMRNLLRHILSRATICSGNMSSSMIRRSLTTLVGALASSTL